jgi:DNA polymerase
VVSDCLRGVIVASDGHTLHVSDYSNIEGRGNAWLSGQADKVEVFRQNGPVYEKMGAAIFRIPLEEVTKESLARFVGKQAELGCGYQMSWLKFQATCAGYGQDLSDEVCQTAVGTFRRVNDKIVLNWKVLEEAALDAVRQPGVSFSVQGGRVKFLCRREMDFLVCTLPSRRRIYYPWPQIEQAETPWGAMRDQLSYMTVHPQTRQWVRTTTYGGKLDENIVQAISRDVLASAMLRLDRARFWLVLTVHDEIVSDDPPADGLSQENFERVMAHVPDWAEGLPIAVEGFEAPRYRK